jgi:hypothetical protein
MNHKNPEQEWFLRSRSPIECEAGGTCPNAPSLDSSFPRMGESRFVLRRISLDTRFRGYDVIQVASANRPGAYIQGRLL